MRFAARLVATVEKTTTVTELIGINIADTKGERYPCTANVNPTILYKNEIANPTFTIDLLLFAILRIFGKR